MGILGRKLIVALVASAAGSLSGLGTGLAASKRPIVQTIAASQPPRMKLSIFHPSSNPEPETRIAAATPPAPRLEKTTESPIRVDSPRPARTTPLAPEPLAVRSGLGDDATPSWRAAEAPVANLASKRTRLSARFGQSEIVDPWGAKR